VLVIDALHAHLADIGAVGPRATGGPATNGRTGEP
jgi:hypothetical protein